MVDPTDRPALIVPPRRKEPPVATLGLPVVIYCRVVGWPRPQITWWRGNLMLPRTSDNFDQKREGSLSIRRLSLRDLGPYTCQAYNGQGMATSRIIVLKALGPVRTTNPLESQYLKYIVSPPRPPVTQAPPRPTFPSYFPALLPENRPYWPPYRPKPKPSTTSPKQIPVGKYF